MTENLIINGVDHSAFNLEWAKRGGCCIFDDSTDVYTKHWKFWRDIPHPLNKNSMTQPLKGE